MTRRLPAPWTVTDNGHCFTVLTADGIGVANVPIAREIAGTEPSTVLTRDEARRVAKAIARLPELLGPRRAGGG